MDHHHTCHHGRSGGRTTQYCVEPHDMVSNDSISPCSTRYYVERIDIVLFDTMFGSHGPIRDTSSHQCVLDLDHHHTRHHRPSIPLFLIDQRQRDGCDDSPVARRSSGKKGGGGWGGGRRDVSYRVKCRRFDSNSLNAVSDSTDVKSLRSGTRVSRT